VNVGWRTTNDEDGHDVVGTAILDRLLHNSHVITIRGDNYQLGEKRRTGLLQKAGPSHETAIV
jgi:DNA replication protein DnaC